MGGYPAYGGHGLHPYLAAGPASLLALVLPFVVLALLVALWAVACWGGRQIGALLSRRSSKPAPARALPGKASALQPVLASDLERDETARLVSHAVGEGRLSIDEGGQRIDAALRARHRHELAALVADLPSHVPASPARKLVSTPLRLGPLAVAGALILVAVLVQALVGLWELWPLAVVALGTSAFVPRRPGLDRSPR
jgi:hypothetical protein